MYHVWYTRYTTLATSIPDLWCIMCDIYNIGNLDSESYGSLRPAQPRIRKQQYSIRCTASRCNRCYYGHHRCTWYVLYGAQGGFAGAGWRPHAASSMPVRSGTNNAKFIWKIIWKSPRAFCFLTKKAVWVQTMQTLSDMLSETHRKTERKARWNLVCNTNSQIQPNTRTAQCARRLFNVPLGRVIP